MVQIRSFGILACLAVVLAGCGGDGSSINSGAIANQTSTANKDSNGPSKGDLALFVTSGLNDKYDHVWVSIKKVELKLAAGGDRTIFEDSRGVGLDLSSLRDDSGPKYRFINELTLPAGTYVGAKITVAKTAMMFATNAATAKAVSFSTDAPKDAVINVEFDPPKMLGTGNDDLVFDFDLSKWQLDGEKLTPTVSTSLGAGLEDADRNAPVVQDGTIDDVKGDVPALTFSLKKEKSADMSVFTSTGTALVSESTGDPFVINKGQAVEVSGTFDTNTRRFEAASIRLKDAKSLPAAQVSGAVSSIDEKTGTWQISPAQVRGLLPDSLTVKVAVTPSAKFFGAGGLELSKEDLFAALSANKSVNVLAEGSFDLAKGWLAAEEVRIQDRESQPHVKLSGVVGDVKADAQTFGVTVDGYRGLMTKPGAGASISVSPNATITDESGKTIDAAALYSALATPKLVDIDGVLDTSTATVTANSIKLSAAPASALKATKKNSAKSAKTTPKKS